MRVLACETTRRAFVSPLMTDASVCFLVKEKAQETRLHLCGNRSLSVFFDMTAVSWVSFFGQSQGNVVLIQYAYPTINYSGDSESMRADLVELVDKVNAQFALPNKPGTDRPQSRHARCCTAGPISKAGFSGVQPNHTDRLAEGVLCSASSPVIRRAYMYQWRSSRRLRSCPSNDLCRATVPSFSLVTWGDDVMLRVQSRRLGGETREASR